ncbi:5912_t:CDS:2 [Ambispora leptoticha]|uniref:5912_t:CDS:1 n=1 Tax=Ambispora leptoticha TaxID=144679 RepID=A0A9N9D7M0_9GLOM|nr:5912_t:CDS:2 [Ambispora leptoticha]
MGSKDRFWKQSLGKYDRITKNLINRRSLEKLTPSPKDQQGDIAQIINSIPELSGKIDSLYCNDVEPDVMCASGIITVAAHGGATAVPSVSDLPLYNMRLNDLVIPLKDWLNPASIKNTFDTADSLDITQDPPSIKLNHSIPSFELLLKAPHLIPFTKKFEWDVAKTSFVTNQIAEYARNGKLPINITVSLRFLRASIALLAPTFDSDPNATFETK